jgi:hypothetical protein
MARVNLTLQALAFRGAGVASVTVARLLRGGGFLFADHKIPASKDAGYSNSRLPPAISTEANEF